MTGLTHDPPAARKARGAFFTPEAVARYVTSWAVRRPQDRVFEPSCGEAGFLLPAAERLAALGAPGDLAGQLAGVEVHEGSARTAARVLGEAGFRADIAVGDFLRGQPHTTYDVVIGNPPYVRYQAFSGEARASAQRAALRAGVALTNLASSWAAFTVHAAEHVRPGGRLGLVLPAEMLTVNYAAPVREFLMRAFGRVRLVVFVERVFPGVLEDVVLLLAEDRGRGPTDHCELLQAHNADALAALGEDDVRRWDPVGDGRWSGALLPPDAAAAYAAALASPDVVPLHAWGKTTLGMVTGRNTYFALTGETVRRAGLRSRDVIRVSPPGSRHLRGLSLTAARLDELDAAGRATWLFRPRGEPSAAGRRYVAAGEATGVDAAYKCRVRSPWWRTPEVPPADLLLTYMNADTARLCTNAAGVRHLNSVHGVYLREEHRLLGRELLPLAALNSVTLLGAEVTGRAYGGGVLKLEPREADRWPMPDPALVAARVESLRAVRRRVRELLASGLVFEAALVVDEALWGAGADAPRVAGAGASTAGRAGGSSVASAPMLDLAALRRGRAALHDRRVARSLSRGPGCVGGPSPPRGS